MVVMFTGCPLIPPDALTLSAHAFATSAIVDSDPACAPEQLQIKPTRMGAPAAFFRLDLAGAAPEREDFALAPEL
jgi:hypothetical protein